MKQANPIRFRFEAKQLVLLAAPIMLSQLAQMGISLTDTIVAGRHSDTSLAGIAIGSAFWVPAFLLCIGVMMAITPLVAHAWGANARNELRDLLQQGSWLALFLGLLMVVLLLLASNLLYIMPMEEETRRQALGYVFAVSFCLPAMAGFQLLRGITEGAQFTRPFVIASTISLLANIPLNYILVFGAFGLPELGGIGCGWATCIVVWLQLLIMLFLIRRHPHLSTLQLFSDWKRPDNQQMKIIFSLGLPIGISLLVESSMFTLIALLLAPLGSEIVAGHQVAMSFISVLFMVPLSLAMALTVQCGYYLGRGDPQRARYVGFIGIGFVLLSASCYSAIILAFSSYIAQLYTPNIIVQQVAISLLFLAAIFQFSDAVQVACAGILRGYKDTRTAFLVVCFAYWVIGLPLGYALSMTDWIVPAAGAEGFWQALIAGLTVAALLLLARFHYLSKQTLLPATPD